VTALNDESLVDLLADYNSWLAHIGGNLFLQEVDVRYAEAKLVELEGYSTEAAFSEIGGKSGSDSSVTRAKALRDTQPEVLRERAELRESKAKRDALTYLHGVLEKDSWLLSRELTRRIGREKMDVRAERYRT
jgi:hypothetical protein